MSAMHKPHLHKDTTKKLAAQLKGRQIYQWLITKGFFPESYVLPPCFRVGKYPKFGKIYTNATKRKYLPKVDNVINVQFPKTELADRTFGIINPEIHSDMAYLIARHWKTIIKTIFHPENIVCPYAFPIPVDRKNPGKIGRQRSGRMIYEFIEMAENDLATEAYKFRCLVKTDVKNFYPSIYTHSIPWALHGKNYIRKAKRRYDYSFVGNKLDRLFQSANDQRTNGIPIGPVVSDLIAEIVLSGCDRVLSRKLKQFKIQDVIAVRYKDDYRILCKDESTAKSCVKALQSSLKEYNLELNEEKTTISPLPEGIFRPWKSMYHAANPRPKRRYSYDRFKETYLSVISIDKQCPGTGVIDRFLSDIVTKKDRLRVVVDQKNLPKILSLLLLLAQQRIKAFPKVLGILEAIIKTRDGKRLRNSISTHLGNYLKTLTGREDENRYLIAWIIYFLAANDLRKQIGKHKSKDPIVRSVYSNRGLIYKQCKDFKLFIGTKAASKKISLLRHLDVFKPQ